MLGLDNYGSDSESDTEHPHVKGEKGVNQSTTKSSLAFLLPPPKGSSQSTPATTASSSTLGLPPPKNKLKRGPVKIKVESLKPVEGNDADDDDEPATKKPRLQSNGERKAGAGSSALLAMLPAPKKTGQSAPTLPPPRVLGSAAGGSETGLVAESVMPPTSGTDDENGLDLSFLPAHLRKPRNSAPAPSTSKVTVAAAPSGETREDEDVADFFSIGSKPKPSLPAATGSSSVGLTIRRGLGSSISSAPVVKEYEPPEPTPYDPYPGYYELPSGEWRAYDPAYYKSHWETWQAQYSTSADIKGKGKDGRGWEGADNDDMTAVNADEEMRNSQLAERERQKGLTAPPTIVQGEAPKVKQLKANGLAKSRHQLSTLLQEAYENRGAIEEKIAQGRRNRKEAGNKYGFS